MYNKDIARELVALAEKLAVDTDAKLLEQLSKLVEQHGATKVRKHLELAKTDTAISQGATLNLSEIERSLNQLLPDGYSIRRTPRRYTFAIDKELPDQDDLDQSFLYVDFTQGTVSFQKDDRDHSFKVDGSYDFPGIDTTKKKDPKRDQREWRWPGGPPRSKPKWTQEHIAKFYKKAIKPNLKRLS